MIPKAPLIPGTLELQSLETIKGPIIGSFESTNISASYINAQEITDGTLVIKSGTISNLKNITSGPNSDNSAVNLEYLLNKELEPSSIINSIQFKQGSQFSGSEKLTYNNGINVEGTVFTTSIITNNLSINNIVIQGSLSPYTLTFPNDIGSENQLLTTDASGNLYWSSRSGPAGIGNQIQFASAGVFSSDANFTFDDTLNVMEVDTINVTSNYITNVLNAGSLEVVDNVDYVTIKQSINQVTNYSLSFINIVTGINEQLIVCSSTQELFTASNGIIPVTGIIFNDEGSYNSSANLTNDNNNFYINAKVNQKSSNNYFTEIISITGILDIFNDSFYNYVILSGSLKIYDSSFTLLSSLNISSLNKIAKFKYLNYIFCSTLTSLKIINIKNSSNPILISTLNLNCEITDFNIQGSLLYIVGTGSTESNNKLSIIDISNIEVPILLGSCTNISNAMSLSVFGSYAYIACNNSIFSYFIIDISNNKNPVKVSYLELNGTSSIYNLGTYSYVAGSFFTIINNNVKEVPTIVSKIIPTTSTTFTSLLVLNDYAYLTNNNGSLYTIDISNIQFPVVTGTYSIPSTSNKIILVDNLLYIVSTNLINKISISNSKLKTSNIGSITSNYINVSQDTTIAGQLTCNSSMTCNEILCRNINLSFENVSINSYNGTVTNNSSQGTITITGTLGIQEISTIIVNNNQVNSNSIIFSYITNWNGNGIPVVNISSISSGSFTLKIMNTGIISMTSFPLEVTFIIH